MLRIWIVSALVAIAVGGGVFLLTSGDDAPPEQTTQELRPPASLQEKEVYLYMRIRPEEDKIFRAAALAFGDKKKPDVQAQMRDMLRRLAQITRGEWASLRQRVEYVVGIQQFEDNKDQRQARIRKDIQKKETLLADAKNKALRKKLNEDITFLNNQLTAIARPISKSDRALTRKFWETLSLLVPSQQGPK